MIPAGPFTLALGESTTVAPPASGGVTWTQVALTNASPYTCQVNIAGPQRWLPAFTADLYDMDPGAQVTVSPVAQLAGASTDASLTADFYSAADTVTGSYPVSLTAQAVAAAVAGNLGVYNAPETSLATRDLASVPISTSAVGIAPVAAYDTTTPLPAGMKALVVENYGNLPWLVNVYGKQSGIRYAWQAIIGTYRPLIVPVDPDSDSTFRLVTTDGSTRAQQPSAVWAMAQPPQLPDHSMFCAQGAVQGYSGDGKVAVPLPAEGANGVVLRSIHSRIYVGSAVTGYQVMRIGASQWAGGAQDLDVIANYPGDATENGDIDLGLEGLLLDSTLSTPILYFYGNNADTVATFFSLTATYEQV